MVKNLKRRVFIKYLRFRGIEVLKILLIAGFFAFFFYRSIWAFIPMLIPAVAILVWERRKQENDQNEQMLRQFSECILSVAGGVKTGYAAENAFLESMKDMEMMYGKEAGILRELQILQRSLKNHVTLERGLQEMGRRTGLEEIDEFAEIFSIAKRNGGSMTEVISLTSYSIRNRAEARKEIHTLLASKRLEQKVMNLMPFLLVLYLQFTNPGYFDIFYEDFTGRILMTVFLLWYLAAYGLSEYIFFQNVG